MFLLFIVMLLLDKKKITMIMVIFITIPLIGYISFYSVKQYYSNFTPEKWQNHIESRYLMFNDMLMKNNLLVKNSEEIKNLLGQAETNFFDIGNKDYKNRSYYLIHDTSWLVRKNIEYLIIYYDTNGYVQKYEVLVYSE